MKSQQTYLEQQLQYGWQSFETQTHQLADAQLTIETQKNKLSQLNQQLEQYQRNILPQKITVIFNN